MRVAGIAQEVQVTTSRSYLNKYRPCSVLRNPREFNHRVQGALLGKTFQTLSIVVIRRLTTLAFNTVDAEWHENPTQDKRLHLHPEGQMPGGKFPLQGAGKEGYRGHHWDELFFFPCLCEKFSATRRLLTPSIGAAIIAIPNGLLSNWCQETDKFIDLEKIGMFARVSMVQPGPWNEDRGPHMRPLNETDYIRWMQKGEDGNLSSRASAYFILASLPAVEARILKGIGIKTINEGGRRKPVSIQKYWLHCK